MEFKDLTPEQQDKIRACNTPEEILDLAKLEGIELSEEQLEQVAGGSGWSEGAICPACGSGNTSYDKLLDVHICNRCNEQF